MNVHKVTKLGCRATAVLLLERCTVLVGCSDRPQTSGSADEGVRTSAAAVTASTIAAAAYSPVQVLTWPGAKCDLQPVGSGDQSVPVIADDLGVAQFGAVPAGPNSTVTALSLACHDDTGRTQSYAIDLTSSATFQALRASATTPDPKSVRPALTGDPASYSQQELVSGGYGVRPDPVAAPESYNRWLEVATKPIRLANQASVPMRGHGAGTIIDGPPPGWSGAMLSNYPTTKYKFAEFCV